MRFGRTVVAVGLGGRPFAIRSPRVCGSAGDAGGDGEPIVFGGPLTVCVAAASGPWPRAWCYEGDSVYWSGRREAAVPLKLDSGDKALFDAPPVDAFQYPRFHGPACLFKEVPRGATPWLGCVAYACLDYLEAHA